jgi:hypothetical protein
VSASTDLLFFGPHPVREVEIVAIDTAGARTLYINAEITSSLAMKIQESVNAEGDDWVLVGCINECVGYLTTAHELSKGGYECEQWPGVFGIADVIARPESEALLVDLCKRAVLECASSTMGRS